MPVPALVDDCPLYDLAPVKPDAPIYPAPTRTLDSDDPREILLALLGSSNIASRRPVFEQYDCLVQSRTVRRPDEADAAVLLLPDGGAIAISIDGSGRRVACDPYRGTIEAVLECAANLACVGAEPLGLTNCLNFGNPEKPHIAWQLSESVRGMADALRALDVPVVGGNVSLYNEGPEGPIYPTPVVGMVGRLPDAARAGRLGFAHEGDAIAFAGPFMPSLPGSELAKLRGEPLPDGLPEVDLAAARRALEVVREAVRAGEVHSAHDVAEGGFAVGLAECCIAGGFGAQIDFRGAGDKLREQLFGEGAGGFLLSGPRPALAAIAREIPLTLFGIVGGPDDDLSHGAGRRRPAAPAARRAARRARRRTRGADRLSPRGKGPAAERRAATLSLQQGRARRPVSEDASPPGMTDQLIDRDGPRDECGVFGIFAPDHDVARLAYFALYALQHRGQESAGIATTDLGGNIMTLRDLGLVSQVFDEQKLRSLPGELALGHVRYSTTGSSAWENAQPVYRSDRREVALAHNGNLTNAVELHAELREQDVAFRSTSDSEIIAALLSTHPAEKIEDAVADVLPRLQRRLLDRRDDRREARRLP